ncbi:MAG: type II secretion system protein GspG [Pseudomonadota bacterium]
MQKVSKYVRRALGAALCVTMVGCASYTADYQQRLLDTLPSTRGVVFDDLEKYPGDVLCGTYTSRNFTTNATDTDPFVVTPSRVLRNPSQAQLAVYCGRDAATALFERYGIGGPDADWAAIEQVMADQSRIKSSVDVYYGTYAYPPLELPQLLDGDYGISDSGELIDPWERSYLYNPGLAGRSLPNIKLETLGRDGKRGGRGADADISIERIDEIRHVLSLQR